jgi:hypothetical protein
VLLSYLLRGCHLDLKHDSVIDCYGGDLACHREGSIHVALESLSLQIDVAGRSTLPESGPQNPALQHKLLGEPRTGEPVEKRLQDLQMQQLINRPLALPSHRAQIEVDTPRSRRPTRSTHSRTSNARRTAGSAPAKCAASSTSCAGLLPGFRSHRRKASHARSVPCKWRILMTSTMERSAE